MHKQWVFVGVVGFSDEEYQEFMRQAPQFER